MQYKTMVILFSNANILNIYLSHYQFVMVINGHKRPIPIA